MHGIIPSYLCMLDRVYSLKLNTNLERQISYAKPNTCIIYVINGIKQIIWNGNIIQKWENPIVK